MTFFDAHSDIWTDVTDRRLRGETGVMKNRHLDRLQKGRVEGSIFVIWVDPPYTRDYVKRTREIEESVRSEIAELSRDDAFRIVHTYDEMMAAKAAGKIYIIIGVEGMAAIGDDLTGIDRYYDFGARHGMLTWNEENALGAGASSGVSAGLKEAGKQAARRMQEKGMLVDVSHLNEAGFWDITKLSTRPIIASHSNCKALCDVPRNLTDDQLRAIRDLDGVVGLNAFSGFIHADPTLRSAEGLARHAARMIDIMGIDHVGCGFDFFEFVSQECMAGLGNADNSATVDLEDCTKIGNLFACFEKMGMSREEMEKIAFRNFQAVFKKAVG